MIFLALIKTLILIFGCAFALRIYYFNDENPIFHKSFFQKTILAVTFLTSTIVFFCNWGLKIVFFVSLVPFLLLVVTIFVTRAHREMKFRQDFVEFMDRLILSVRSGRGFRVAYEISNEKSPSFSQIKLKKLFEGIVFEVEISTKDIFLKEIYDNFLEIDRNSQKTLLRLQALRKKIKIEDEFRRRSGAIIRQARIQAFFLTVIYGTLFLFVGKTFGFTKHQVIFLTSALIFLVGMCVYLILAGRKVWRI